MSKRRRGERQNQEFAGVVFHKEDRNGSVWKSLVFLCEELSVDFFPSPQFNLDQSPQIV